MTGERRARRALEASGLEVSDLEYLPSGANQSGRSSLRPVATFKLINATVMTRAERPTADSWVHLAQTRTMGLPMVIGFSLAAAASFGAAIFAGLQAFGVIPQVNADVSEVGPLLGMLFMGALGLLLGWLASLMIRREFRDGSVGARPSGVALGETAVAVNVPGRDVEILWTQMTGVDVVATMPASNGRTAGPMIRISLTPGTLPGDV